MKLLKLSAAVALATMGGTALAAGPLYTTDDETPQPLKWNTSNGPIPVYTDGGEAFTFDFDGVTPFITIERANEITQFAFDQWNNVPTSTFNAQIAGTIEEQIGIADITADNADSVYYTENGYGFWVIYDTDGSILEDMFGVPRSAVLGIAFPEFANDKGEIVEATALMNGWNVDVNDPNGEQVAGVFTHEFGHAINLSHSQVNGQMAYQSYLFAPKYPGVKGCVDPVYHYAYPSSVGETMDPNNIETMFPFINHRGVAGRAQSTVDMPDDIAAISNIYPTPEYASSTGTITGTLKLKDGDTEYSGINVIARNVNNPLGDAVSDMSGSATQGKVGPDGRYTIRNLTPGEQYVVYIEQINSGGYPTARTALVSEAEYWNDGETHSPADDNACLSTAIVAEAGVEKEANIIFNGYTDGVQFTPIVNGFLTDMSKNGRRAAGNVGPTAFLWDVVKGFSVFPSEWGTTSADIDRNGQNFLVGGVDLDQNGIGEPAIYHYGKGLTLLGDLNGNTCGGQSQTGINAATPWAMDDSAKTVVGTAYVDKNGNGSCQEYFAKEVVPFVWNEKEGMTELPTDGLGLNNTWIRAHAISGNGEVIVGNAGGSKAVGWYQGQAYNLNQMVGATEAYGTNYDGTMTALTTIRDGVILWNPSNSAESFTNIGGLEYCEDIAAPSFFGGDLCQQYPADFVQQQLGIPPMIVTDMSDDGSVMIGRAGNFRTGFHGAMYLEGLGWITLNNFLASQGVVEAVYGMDNPYAIDANGNKMMGGLAGAQITWFVDMDHAYVCDNGQSIQTGFPRGFVNKVKAGAEMGRCEHVQ
ncbi:hypothetical protein [Kangiella marina]|uniref:Peptidase metallopeptidase domain-containing protein n=1 Tax=Kangiella marina TaxID=1079178 RepID=A0ABP8IJS9_9GAMM